MPQADLVLLHAPSVYDFRKESILYGPVSDLVPSTPVFEMYPIGLTTIAEYLERHGFRVRIVNLAVRMLGSNRFDPEKLIRKLRPAAFGIDLHWMPHAHGAIKIARLCKQYHPDIPVMFGGFSSTYFHEELVRRPEVDFVVRGDSTEVPVLKLMQYLAGPAAVPGSEAAAGSAATAHPAAPASLAEIPNLTWQEPDGTVRVNELTYSPDNLDHLLIDYSYVVRAVARYRDLASFVPFKGWLGYPITAALSVRGCSHNCRTCGGSAATFAALHNRQRPAYRAPEDLAQDIRNIARFSNGPVFILGDIRQAGEEYADRFLRAIHGYQGPVIVELFDAAEPAFIRRLAEAMPNWTLEISLETHSEEVRAAFGRPYKNAAIEETMRHALANGVQRLDIFFMIGLPRQDYQSVMDTVDYCEYLMRDLDPGPTRRLIPFISPLAPFLDPGGPAFVQPERYGYRLFARTLEEHRQALVQPSWKYVLNYETEWMNRDEIVNSTYEAGLRLNRLKARYGLVDVAQAGRTEARILKARRLIAQVDDIMSIRDEGRRARLLRAIKPQVDDANLSTVCDKAELNVPLSGIKFNLPRAACFFAEQVWNRLLPNNWTRRDADKRGDVVTS